jgi:pimeloyl-ACP methyl ester carboxylesterase
VSFVKRAGITAGVLAGVAGTVYAAQRLTAARLRGNPDGEARKALDTPLYVDRTLDTHDRGSLYLVEHGEPTAPAIVLSHGVTLSVRTWFHQLDDLPKQGFRTIAFDHRGHGKSVLGEEGHSIENLAKDVKTVVEGLDLHDAVLVGHSMGGVAVQAFVIQYPEIARERIAGIVLLSTLAHTPLGSRSTQTRAKLERLTKRVPNTQRIWESKNLGFVLSRLGFGRDPHPSHVELVRRMMADCTTETRHLAPRTLVGLDLTPDLPKVDIPTLVIGGTADMITPPSEAKRIANLIPGARLLLMPDGGHMLMLEQAEALNEVIADFAREVRSSKHSAA